MKKMIILIAALLMAFVAGQAQTLQSFFDKYGNDERFQYVSVGKGMMNMASAFGGMAKNDKDMMSKMKGVKILTLESDAGSGIMQSVVRELDQIIDKGNFETAVEVRDKGQRVNIYYRVIGNDNADMLIVTKEKNELNLIWINGKMTKEEMMNSFSGDARMIDGLALSIKMTDTIS